VTTVMKTSDFDYKLPPELIAQHPVSPRDSSRLMVLHRDNGWIEHRIFKDIIAYFNPGDVLVLNNSKVIPARLKGKRKESGADIEVFLLEELTINRWEVLLGPGKRMHENKEIVIVDPVTDEPKLSCKVESKTTDGHFIVRFNSNEDIKTILESIGKVPLPPYIVRTLTDNLDEDKNRYQTVFAGPPGSVAAPTAGLHFTEELLNKLRDKGVKIVFITLHVGAGTFAPVKTEDICKHVMHEERFSLDSATVNVINEAKVLGKRIFCVGTTSVRVLETVARLNDGKLTAYSGRTNLFIRPPWEFKVTDVLITNFHLPKSTLLMLVSAFCAPGSCSGRDMLLAAYAEAIERKYRFFSYGDAMLIL